MAAMCATCAIICTRQLRVIYTLFSSNRELVAAMCATCAIICTRQLRVIYTLLSNQELVAAMCKLEVRARVSNTVNEYLKLCFNTIRSSSIITCMLLETTFPQANYVGRGSFYIKSSTLGAH